MYEKIVIDCRIIHIAYSIQIEQCICQVWQR